jgi:2-phosphoglycerate kinase
MIDKRLSFSLPSPWENCTFTTEQVGPINFLVGPNGSGKSRFAATLAGQLENARLLGTDRLRGMEQTDALADIYGDRLNAGIPKSQFDHFKTAGRRGAGIDTLILLESGWICEFK